MSDTTAYNEYLASLSPESREMQERQDAGITEGRTELGSALNAAEFALRRALRAVDQLRAFYDIEFVESTAADDIEHHLNTAARSVRDATAHYVIASRE